MEGEGNSNVMSLVFAVILIIAMGVGGYYVGKYFDTKENDRLIAEFEEDNQQEPTTYTYEDADLGISLEFPIDWVLVSYDDLKETEDIPTEENGFQIFSPSSDSVFIYSYIANKEVENYSICESDDEISEDDIRESCIQKSGYSRFSIEGEDATQLWNIAEMHSDLNTDNYIFVVSDGFTYISASSTDLTILDEIMDSVKRL